MTAGTNLRAADLIARARQNPAPLSAWEDAFLTDAERRVDLTHAQMAKLQEIAGRISLTDLDARLADRIRDLAETLLGAPTHRTSHEWRYPGRDGGAEALRIFISGSKRGDYRDYHANAYGGPLDLVQHARRDSREGAVAWALAWLGGDAVLVAPRPVAAPEAPNSEAARASGTLDRARDLWRGAVPAAGTVVETYLASRGLQLEPGAPLRFHPHAWRNPQYGPRGPAMIALMTDPETGTGCGAHITYLRPDGRGKAEGKAKVMLGRAGCIRLTRDDDVTLGLGIAEGVETALSVAQAFHWRPMWAATSAGGITRFPVLPGVDALTIFADTGDAGTDAARACAMRWSEAGREARICTPPRDDFNTLIQECAA